MNFFKYFCQDYTYLKKKGSKQQRDPGKLFLLKLNNKAVSNIQSEMAHLNYQSGDSRVIMKKEKN